MVPPNHCLQLMLGVRWLSLLLVSTLLAACARTDADNEANLIRQLERDRLQSLVTADMPTARRLHADDFQLITPDGSEFTKETYLGKIESGALDYKVWEPGPIEVRLYGHAAVIRYDDSRFEVFVDGQPARAGTLRHIDVYERRDGQWQVVWSQASGGEATSGQ